MSHINITSSLDNAKVQYGTLRLTLRDRNGNIVKDKEQPVESYIRQYWVLHRAIHAGLNNSFLLPLSGSGRTFDQPLGYDAGGNANSYNSIVVGSNSAGVIYDNTRLGTLVLHGNTSGRLAASAPIMGYNEATGQVTISRTFTNNFNGVDVDVNEVGVAIGIDNVTSTGGEVMLAIRDVTGSTFTVLYLATLTVSYTLDVPFGTANYAMLFGRHCIGRDNNEMRLYNNAGNIVNSATWSDGTDSMSFVSGVGHSWRGIVVGSNNDAYAFNTFGMSNQVAHGSNVGELFYYDSAISSLEQVTTTTNQSTWYLTRTFKNKSNTAVTIREIGLVSNVAIGATNNTYLFDRRVVSDTSVNANGILTVNWKFNYDF
jgi:hypothetical protein